RDLIKRNPGIHIISDSDKGDSKKSDNGWVELLRNLAADSKYKIGSIMGYTGASNDNKVDADKIGAWTKVRPDVKVIAKTAFSKWLSTDEARKMFGIDQAMTGPGGIDLNTASMGM